MLYLSAVRDAEGKATGIMAVALDQTLSHRQERALRESVAFAYGRRELADLRRLKAVLWAAGFPDPSPRRSQSEDAEPETPVSKHP